MNESHAEFEDKVSNMELRIQSDEGEMMKVFNNFPHREGFLEIYCSLMRKGNCETANTYLRNAVSREIRKYAETLVKDGL